MIDIRILAALSMVAVAYASVCLAEKKVVTPFCFPLPPDERRWGKISRNFAFLTSGVLWALYPETRPLVGLGWLVFAAWLTHEILNMEDEEAPCWLAALGALIFGYSFMYAVVYPDTAAWVGLALYGMSGALVLLYREVKRMDSMIAVIYNRDR